MKAEQHNSAPVRGRGSQLNPANRFETVRLEVLGDHLDVILREQPTGQQVPTVVYRDRSRTVINRVDSPDLDFRWTVNPYRGCEHGCTYCYARPTHETLGFSCGLDFETKIVAKVDAPELLARELKKTSWCGETIVMSGVTDPYQPVEARMRVTRRCLEVMERCGQPVSLVTKNRLILRDLDVLRRLNDDGLVQVTLSITSLDSKLSGLMEPRACSPGDRLHTLDRIASAGISVSVLIAPVIPGLNDREIPGILEAVAAAGATGAGYVLLRLPLEVRSVFLEWLHRTFPDRAPHVESLLREVRGGEITDSRFGHRMRGQGPVANQIDQMFRMFRRRHGLDRKPAPLSRAKRLDDELLF